MTLNCRQNNILTEPRMPSLEPDLTTKSIDTTDQKKLAKRIQVKSYESDESRINITDDISMSACSNTKIIRTHYISSRARFRKFKRKYDKLTRKQKYIKWKFNEKTIQYFVQKTKGDIPTMDVFGSDRYYQRICTFRVHQRYNFFNIAYDRPDFWKKYIVWCNAPKNKEIMVHCLNKFKSRQICGYLVIPRWRGSNSEWIQDALKICTSHIYYGSHIILFINYKK